MDLDLALLNDKPTVITDSSSTDEKSLYKASKRSNRLSLMFMRMNIANNIKSTIPQTESAREYLKFVEERFHSADMSLAGTLMDKLMTMKFDRSHSMQNHIIEMTNITIRLQTLGMKVDDSFLIQFILNSLPPEYGPFQINYNTIKDKCNISELSSILTQEESRLKKQWSHSINLMGQGAGKGLKVKANKFKKKKAHAKAQQDANKEYKVDTCRFCNKEGQYQKDCLKRKAWFEKKGIFSAFVCFESNLVEVPNNTWWLDSGATAHVSTTLQGFLTIQTTNPNKDFFFIGNSMKATTEGIRTYRLIMETGRHLDLLHTLYQYLDETLHEETTSQISDTNELQEMPLRKSQRVRKSAILDDYVVYLQESDFDIGLNKDPVLFSQVIKSNESDKWIDSMNEELKSMEYNKVWDLVELPKSSKRIGYRWVFKTKHDSNGNIERYKARLVAKGYTQKGGIDYKETFSLVSEKDSLRIIMALVAHYDLELHQMDVKLPFLMEISRRKFIWTDQRVSKLKKKVKWRS
uniref:Uncharacterized protein LOC104249184 n=1 Tax=Nicotiana sylvestris TaxID=4096 RepID=A0A1U7YIC5_NICSY|nr:PREDICTED: uncharacterized protein LOC104249184 [Nicotiana sylvestris]